MKQNKRRCSSYHTPILFDEHPADQIRNAVKRVKSDNVDPQAGATFVAKVKNESSFLASFIRPGIDPNL